MKRLHLPTVAFSIALACAGARSAAATLPPALPPAIPTAAQASAATARDIAGRAGEDVVTFDEYEQLLVTRRAASETGRSVLRQMLNAAVLDRLAGESRLSIGPPEVEARWKQIEEEMNASGQGGSLRDVLREEGVDEATFREFLRLAIVQEVLSRRALGIREGRPVPADQQEMWLDQIIDQRGTDFPAPPWPDGVAARCGDLSVKAADFLAFLRTQVPPEDVREDLHQLLLVKKLRRRMPDVSGDALLDAVEAELARRRAELEADPRYKGLSYEQLLGSQGLTLDGLRSDPALRAAAFAQLWSERTLDEEALQRAYREERAFFDGRFGAAVEARVIFLRAAVMTNQLIPRTFDAAERELDRLRGEVRSVADFERLARARSEDPGTREGGGQLGFVTREDERVPSELRAALFENLPPQQDQDPKVLRFLPLVRVQSGVLLVLVGALRPAPAWEEMRGYVERELRRRLLEEVLPIESVRTFRDAQ